MAQHDYVIANGTGAAVRSDLNNALAAIVSQNSGATAPSPTYAYQFWADTTTGLLKLRNSANSAWITLFQLDGEWSTLPVENGTAAAPSIYFKDSGTDTGFYSPGTDQVAVSTAGTGRLFINSSGLVGVGTSSPSEALTVSGKIQATTEFKSETGNDLRLNAGSANRDIFMQVNGSTLMTVQGSSGRAGIGTSTPGAKLEVSGGNIRLDNNQGVEWGGVNNYIYGNESTDFIAIATNGNERARIDSSGRWLLGTSSARANFENSTFSAAVQVEGTDYAGSRLALIRNGGGGGINLCATGGASVGSNTAVSSGAGLGEIVFAGSDGSEFVNAASIAAVVDATPGANDMPGRLVFSTTADGASSPTERVRIDSSGYVTIYKNASNLARLNFEASSTRLEYSDATGHLSFYTNSSARVRINYGGGFVPVTDNSQSLGSSSERWTAVYAVNGTIQTSDLREKTDVATSSLGTDFIKQLRPVSYKFKVGENVVTKGEDGETDIVTPRPGERTHWGFIAQEVKEVVDAAGVDFGGWILTDKDDPDSTQGLRYDQFIAPLTKALQEALAEIDVLKAKVAALESA